MKVTMWQGKQLIARCGDEVCRQEMRADTEDQLKGKVRQHIRQYHGIREEPTWVRG